MNGPSHRYENALFFSLNWLESYSVEMLEILSSLLSQKSTAGASLKCWLL